MGNNKPLLAHLCLFGSGAFWGLMAPVGKDAMTHGIEGIDMVSFRVLGGAILFWLTSLFTRREHIPTTDIIKLAGAGLFGLVFNQCCYTIGLSITSPSNSSIMTTSMPIFAMILSFLILREPITWKKVAGVLLKILVKPGDVVSKGQNVLVLEAMKMENNITSDYAGKVKRILVQEGKAVTAGAKLIEIEI